MISTIQLTKRWVLGAQIGAGGFGHVFEAVDENGCTAAVKLIPKEPGANRELLFEDLTGIRCVVPIIDLGETDAHWVLVMPRAEMSLRAYLKERRVLSPEETITILKDMATALADLGGRVVHRDIKPENVLRLDGQWCLSDFGIARYAEASTAPDTHKWAWSAPYNAPERWRGERATPASDVYSFGVMAFELLMGNLPFPGPDFPGDHLTKDSPPVGGPALLASLVTECMFKAPEVRPPAGNILARLSLIPNSSSPAARQLQAANQTVVQQIASEEARRSAARSVAERRREMVISASKVLDMVRERLSQTIRNNAPQATTNILVGERTVGKNIKLGRARLIFRLVEEARDDMWGTWKPKFEVIAYASIEIRVPPDRYGHEGRGHSLWFCDAQETGVFRWYETAFMISPLIPKRARINPFPLSPGEEAGKALRPGIAEYDVAWPFTPIDRGNDAEFLERWMSWLAAAATGASHCPSPLPERKVEGSWRQL